MTDTPSPTDKDRELIDHAIELRRHFNDELPNGVGNTIDALCDRLESRLAYIAKLQEALASIYVAIPLGPHDAVSTWRNLAIACQSAAHNALNRSTDRAT